MIINQGEEIDNKNFVPSFEKSFGIKDEAFILQILRTNTYSDPIGSICREVISNCRDSHREAGKADIPVEVELSEDDLTPSKKSLIFRDFGIGLSPERINEVYTVYGESTKRTSNEFTGGFGLGAKTPFAYTDSFSVNTIFNEVKYSYQLVIDKTEKGKIIEVNRQLTDEPNMTEVVIPIEDKDVRIFTEKLLYVISFWDVKPKLIGFENSTHSMVESYFYKLENIKTLYENNYGRMIQDSTNSLPNISILVDKIIYPLNLSSLKKDFSLSSYLSKTLVFEFGNGELDLSVSREQLYYSKRTKIVIQRRLDNFINTIRKEFKSDVSTLSTDREKLHWYKENFNKKWDVIRNNISGVRDVISRFVNSLSIISENQLVNFKHSFDDDKKKMKVSNLTNLSTYSLTIHYSTFYFNSCNWWKFPVIIKPAKDLVQKGRIESLKVKYPEGFILAEKMSFQGYVKLNPYGTKSKKQFYELGRKDIHILGNLFDLENFRTIEKVKVPRVKRDSSNLDRSKKVFSGFRYDNDKNLKSAKIHKKEIDVNLTNIIISFDSLDEVLKGQLTASEVFNSNRYLLEGFIELLDKSKMYNVVFLTRDEVKSFIELFPKSITFTDFLISFLTKDVINKFVISQLVRLLGLDFHRLNYDKLDDYSYIKLNTISVTLSIYEKFKSELPEHRLLNKALRLFDKNNFSDDFKVHGLKYSNLLYYIIGKRIFSITKTKNILDSYKKKFGILNHIRDYNFDRLIKTDLRALTEYIKIGLGEIK